MNIIETKSNELALETFYLIWAIIATAIVPALFIWLKKATKNQANNQIEIKKKLTPSAKSLNQPDSSFYENDTIPQSMQFMIDYLPTIRKLIKDWPTNKILEVLDVGTGTGSGADLLATLHKGKFFKVQMKVDAIERRTIGKSYADYFFPNINYIVGEIFDLEKDRTWDLIILSHTMEHLSDPFPYIEELKRRARHWVLVYSPFEEKNRIKGHQISIMMDMVKKLNPILIEQIKSPGWNGWVERGNCILFVLKGKAQKI